MNHHQQQQQKQQLNICLSPHAPSFGSTILEPHAVCPEEPSIALGFSAPEAITRRLQNELCMLTVDGRGGRDAEDPLMGVSLSYSFELLYCWPSGCRIMHRMEHAGRAR